MPFYYIVLCFTQLQLCWLVGYRPSSSPTVSRAFMICPTSYYTCFFKFVFYQLWHYDNTKNYCKYSTFSISFNTIENNLQFFLRLPMFSSFSLGLFRTSWGFLFSTQWFFSLSPLRFELYSSYRMRLLLITQISGQSCSAHLTSCLIQVRISVYLFFDLSLYP